jgi:hypothetical protein
MGCGHSRLSETPVRYCKDARIKEDDDLKSKAELCEEGDAKEIGSSVLSFPDNDGLTKASDKATPDSSRTSRSIIRDMNEKLVVPVIAPSTEDNSNSTRALQTKRPKSVAKSTKSMRFVPLGPLKLLLPTFMKTSQLDASKPPGTQNPILEPCREGQVHPLHTRKLEPSCPICAHERLQRLREVDSLVQEVRLKPDGWQWRYQGAKEERANGTWGVGRAAGGLMGGWNKKNCDGDALK